MALTVSSTLFEEGGQIPKSAAHPSAGGDNVSPDLSWTGLPPGTASVAVTCYDPDAPTTIGFSHWILANLSPDVDSLPAGAGAAGSNPPGSVLGFIDWGDSQYGGMGPPPGEEHRYQFTVYALDTPKLPVDDKTSYAKFRFLARQNILEMGTLTGLFRGGG